MDTKKIIDDAMPDIRAAVAQQLIQSIMASITYETTEEIKKTVVKELVEELGPKVRAVVQAHREELIAKVLTDLDSVAAEAGTKIGEALRSRLAGRFKDSWSSEQAVKAVFGF